MASKLLMLAFCMSLLSPVFSQNTFPDIMLKSNNVCLGQPVSAHVILSNMPDYTDFNTCEFILTHEGLLLDSVGSNECSINNADAKTNYTTLTILAKEGYNNKNICITFYFTAKKTGTYVFFIDDFRCNDIAIDLNMKSNVISVLENAPILIEQTEINEGDAYILTVKHEKGAYYVWVLPNEILAAGNSITVTNSGNYYVEMIRENGCISTANTILNKKVSHEIVEENSSIQDSLTGDEHNNDKPFDVEEPEIAKDNSENQSEENHENNGEITDNTEGAIGNEGSNEIDSAQYVIDEEPQIEQEENGNTKEPTIEENFEDEQIIEGNNNIDEELTEETDSLICESEIETVPELEKLTSSFIHKCSINVWPKLAASHINVEFCEKIISTQIISLNGRTYNASLQNEKIAIDHLATGYYCLLVTNEKNNVFICYFIKQ